MQHQIIHQEVHIQAGQKQIDGILTIPEHCRGIVLFAHGSGSGRFSTRNQYVASQLTERHIGSLLMDLLTAEEEGVDMQTRELRFNIPFLSERLIAAHKWLKNDSRTKQHKTAFFGASTGAAAALAAAARLKGEISSVVSRGGRPDLARDYLGSVVSPTLLIVGGNDLYVIELNEEAYEKLNCEKHMDIVPGATHLFEEQGTLEEVARLSRDWFLRHF